MCTLSASDYDAYETDETATDTIITTIDATVRVTDTKIFCKKCGCEGTEVCLRGKNTYCKTCFLTMTMHKFRATLGKSKSVRPNDTIMIGYSGKVNSTVLVHLAGTLGIDSTTKRIPLQCKLLYIDDGMVRGRTIEERELIRNALVEEAKNVGITLYVISLTKYVTRNFSEDIEPVTAQDGSAIQEEVVDVQQLEEMFDSLESDTAKDELLRQMRRKLLVLAARKLSCNKIFVADTCVDLAIKVLGDVSTGRGSQLSLNVGFSDTRYFDVVLLRPLKDFTADDVANYLDCHKLTPVLSSIEYNRYFPVSIRSTAKNFVDRLNSEFHGTVSTIYRTSEKLATKTEELDNANPVDAKTVVNDVCVLCELPVEEDYPQEGQPSVVQARVFSKLVSTAADTSVNVIPKSQTVVERSCEKQPNSMNPAENKRCGCDGGDRSNHRTQSLPAETIEKYLCYGCRLIFFSSNQTHSVLPRILLDTIREKLQLMRLQKEIQDFLL